MAYGLLPLSTMLSLVPPVLPHGAALKTSHGIRLHALVFRSSSPTAGLLIVHGLQSHAGWIEASGTAAELATCGVTSLAYDRRGSGRSAGLAGHATSARDFIDD